LDAKVSAELFAQRDVLLEVLLRPTQYEPVSGRLSFQLHRQQEQGRRTDVIRLCWIEEAQLTQREIQDIDALLFEHGARLVEDLQQPLLQMITLETSAQSRSRALGRF